MKSFNQGRILLAGALLLCHMNLRAQDGAPPPKAKKLLKYNLDPQDDQSLVQKLGKAFKQGLNSQDFEAPAQKPGKAFKKNLDAQDDQALAQKVGKGFKQNLDAKDYQQMMMQRLAPMIRDRLEITNDEEWAVIEVRLIKVLQARMEIMADGAGLLGMGGKSIGLGAATERAGGFGFQVGSGQPDPAAVTLQTAVESHATTAELKGKLKTLQEARQAKQANLAKAQEELRQLLSTRQESIASLLGILD